MLRWKTMRKVAVILAANLVLIAVVAAVFEAGLRIESGKRPSNDGRAITWGHRVVNNRFGFREREFAAAKPAQALRIMVLGDSLTWGVGLAEGERYTNLLERRLAESYPEKRVEVLNFGAVGGPTVVERDILRNYIDRVRPDLIIVGFCLNDTQPRSENYSTERARYAWLFAQIAGLRKAGLTRVSEALLRRVSTLLERTGCIPDGMEALWRTYATDSREWKNFVKALRDIKKMSDDRMLPPPVFAILNQGSSATGATAYGNPDAAVWRYLRCYHQAEKAAGAAGFVTVNFEKEFASELLREETAVNQWDGHPSARCNEVYARKLRRVVAPLLRLGACPDR